MFIEELEEHKKSGCTSGGVCVPSIIYTHARRLRSLLLNLRYVFRALVNSLVC